MKRFLQNKKGVTILEGLIALTLLALVATGTFAVLLSTSRRSSQPDIREEMTLAVERATQKLQAYIYPSDISLASDVQAVVGNGLCGGDSTPLNSGTHNISCLLPPICDVNNESAFTYTVRVLGSQPLARPIDRQMTFDEDGNVTGTTDVVGQNLYEVQFNITCNGYSL